jgi:pantothenate kinase
VQCGLKIEEFWQMTWRDFSIYVTANERNELREWHRVRKLAHTMYSTVVEQKKWKNEQDWWRLPDEEQPVKARPLEQHEIERLVNFLQAPQKGTA